MGFFKKTPAPVLQKKIDAAWTFNLVAQRSEWVPDNYGTMENIYHRHYAWQLKDARSGKLLESLRSKAYYVQQYKTLKEKYNFVDLSDDMFETLDEKNAELDIIISREQAQKSKDETIRIKQEYASKREHARQLRRKACTDEFGQFVTGGKRKSKRKHKAKKKTLRHK